LGEAHVRRIQAQHSFPTKIFNTSDHHAAISEKVANDGALTNVEDIFSNSSCIGNADVGEI
jgi:hypothetical protein